MHIPTPEELAAMAGVDLTAETSSEVDAAASATPVAASAPAADVSPELVQATTQLAAAQAELVTAQAAVAAVQAELATAKAAADTANAQASALADIVMASVKSMTVALGGTAASVEATIDLAAKHAEVSAQFKSKYRAGGVANNAAAAQKATAPAAAMPPAFAELAMSLPGAK